MSPASTVLVGFGMIGAGFAADRKMASHFDYACHAQVLRDHPDFEWAAVVDPSETARNAATAWDVPLVVPSIDDLPDTFRPEVAVLATGPEVRDAALARFDGLKLAVVEKPLASDADAAARLIADCDARQIGMQVNLFRRAEKTTRALSDGELAERIGAPQAIFGIYGNGLHNNGIHLIDLARMLAGEVREVRALATAMPLATSPIAGDVAVPFSLTLESGVCATLQPLDFAHYREVGLDIWGTKGRLEILQEGLLMRTSPAAPHRALDVGAEIANDAPVILEGDYGNALYALYDNAARWLAGEAPLVSPGSNALTDERVVEAVLHSAANDGAPVALTQ